MVQGMLMGTEASVSLDGVLGRDLVDTSSGFEPVSESYGGEEKHQYCTECVVKLRAAPGGDTRRRAGLGGEGWGGRSRGRSQAHTQPPMLTPPNNTPRAAPPPTHHNRARLSSPRPRQQGRSAAREGLGGPQVWRQHGVRVRALCRRQRRAG